MNKCLLAAAAAVVSTTLSTAPVKAGGDPYLADIMMVAFTFCPRGWAEANGQLLPINQNQALYSLLGTTYGGDGRTSFALPDLRGRSPIAIGQGPGLPNYTIGQKGGEETTTTTLLNLPSHTHNVVNVPTADLMATRNGPTTNAPAGNLLPTFTAGNNVYATSMGTPAPMHDGTVALDVQVTLGNTGGGLPQNNMQPFEVLRYCIAVNGVFPSRN